MKIYIAKKNTNDPNRPGCGGWLNLSDVSWSPTGVPTEADLFDEISEIISDDRSDVVVLDSQYISRDVLRLACDVERNAVGHETFVLNVERLALLLEEIDRLHRDGFGGTAQGVISAAFECSFIRSVYALDELNEDSVIISTDLSEESVRFAGEHMKIERCLVTQGDRIRGLRDWFSRLDPLCHWDELVYFFGKKAS